MKIYKMNRLGAVFIDNIGIQRVGLSSNGLIPTDRLIVSIYWKPDELKLSQF